MGTYGAIKDFTDLECWKLARQVRIEVYKIVRILPPEEKYDLSSQMRKAAVSATSNIAEGHGRFHFQENIRFCRISRGSLYEIRDQLITCFDEKYITRDHFNKVYSMAIHAAKTLNGYIRYLKKQKVQTNT